MRNFGLRRGGKLPGKRALLVAAMTLFVLSALPGAGLAGAPPSFPGVARPAGGVCPEPFVPVATPLMDGEGLYADGSNSRPPAHAAAGMAAVGQITPRDASGAPDPNGKIVLLSIGVSNTMIEFRDFERNVLPTQPGVNPSVQVISGAVSGQPVDKWLDPDGVPWQVIDDRLAHLKATPEQVQAVWMKHTYIGTHPWQELQADLETVTENLRDKFPNLQVVYLSSRTRAYTFVPNATSPEPAAFETGYAVKGLVTKYIDGEMPARPYVTWGPYLWADGENPRSDGLTWLAEDLQSDCVHPSDSGARKVANMLLAFFTTDETAAPWFMASGQPLPVTPPATRPATATATATLTPALTATVTATATTSPTSTATTAPTATATTQGTPTPTATAVVWPPGQRFYLPLIIQ